MVFVILFPEHIKALIEADEVGIALSPHQLDIKYYKLCWNIHRNKSWADKFSVYAGSWILGRPVHIYIPCFKWDNRVMDFNTVLPMGGVEVDRDLGALRDAFANPAAVDDSMPEWVSYSAAPSFPANRTPAAIFLYRSHYVPLFFRKGYKREERVEPSLRCWVDSMPAIHRDHPLPADNDALRKHFNNL